MKITSKKVKEYMEWRTDEELRHCPDCIAAACNDVAIKFNNEFNERLKAYIHIVMVLIRQQVEI